MIIPQSGIAKAMALLVLVGLLGFHLKVYTVKDGKPQFSSEELRQTLVRTIKGENPGSHE